MVNGYLVNQLIYYILSWPLVVEKLDYWIYGLSLISSNVVGQIMIEP